MTEKKLQAQTKRDLMIEVWEYLDCESVGESELRMIQEAVVERFGEGAVDSPASIARTLADEGAVLRHPEVLNFDTAWRESEETVLADLQFATLREALESMRKLEAARREFARAGRERLVSLRALKLKSQAQLLARSKLLNSDERAVADEVAQWLTVWLGEPELFADWVSLRQRAPEFKKKFRE